MWLWDRLCEWTDRQIDRQTSRLVFTARMRPQVRMHPVRNARRTSCPIPNVPRSRNSERAPLQIYEHAKCRLFERTYLQRAYGIPCRQQMGSSAVLRACRSTLVLAASTRCLQRAHSIGRGVASILVLWRLGQNSKCISSVSFVRIESIFYNTQETKTQKNDGPEFWNSNSVVFWEFFEIFK